MAFKLRELGRIQFFQSSLPYLNNNAVTKYSRQHTKYWRSEDPHPSNHKFLSIANGHYGIYFTIFNHELRREEKAGLHDHGSHVLLVFPSSSLLALTIPYFVISKVKDEVYSHINHLKTVSREFLSSWALVRPKSLQQQHCFVRHFTTSAPDLADREPLKLIPLSQPKIEELPQESAPEEPAFEESFQKTQSDKILHIYNTHTSPEDLDIIYPLYQALKRNDIALPSIQLYNIVLESILSRALDNGTPSLSSIESRLTNLLTVYQDILYLCSTTSLRPDNSTYDLVLKGIFEGCVEAVTAGRSPSVAHHIYQDFETKAQEFGQVGTNLFLSLKDHQNLTLSTIMPNLLSAITNFPTLLTSDLVKRVLEHRDLVSGDGAYYVGLIDLSKHFAPLGMENLSKEEIYQYLISVFEDYKVNTETCPELMAYEYNVYSALILALIANGNLLLATKFLDDILVDYKSSLEASAKDIAIAKPKVSALLSVYLEAIMAEGSTVSLYRSYRLLEKFNDVPYLPELSIHVYNKLIGLFINEYSKLELQRREVTDDKLAKSQKSVYEIIWKLYEKVAIRSDYQNNLYDATIFPKKFVSCREFLLSLSIDLGDHSKVLRLLKEIIAKDHAVSDWNVSKKMVLYLLNAAHALNNEEYVNLCWTILEQQAVHHTSHSNVLNGFVSEHLPYLIQLGSAQTSDRLINSPMVMRAFASFKLADDNIYGLMNIMNYVMNLAHSTALPSSIRLRILQYQAYLIKEFEDTENHYLQLSEDLELFKGTVKSSFTQLVSSNNDITTTDISEACDLLNIEVSTIESYKNTTFSALDYSTLLSINFDKGVQCFTEAFEGGFNFNVLTWKTILNRNFVMGSLVKDKRISIDAFVKRLLSLSLEINEKHLLLSSLIAFEHEKVNVEVFKSLRETDESQALNSERVLDAFAAFCNSTDNAYFLKMFEDSFPDLLAGCNGNKWVAKFLEKLTSLGKLKEAIQYLPKERLYSLDVTVNEDVSLLASVLTCLVTNKDDSKVTEIMKHYFSDENGKRLLMQSDRLLSIFVNYFIQQGNYEVVIQRFESMANKSPELAKAIGFAKLMVQLSGTQHTFYANGKDKDAATLALELLSRDHPKGMRQLLSQNEKLVLTTNTQRAIFDSMVHQLTRASNMSQGKYARAVRAKFEAAVKLCKTMRLSELSVSSLVGVIRLLGSIKARDTLNILVNKFINRGETASIVNLYFLQVKITSDHEANLLKEEFEKALVKAGDTINLLSLAQA